MIRKSLKSMFLSLSLLCLSFSTVWAAPTGDELHEAVRANDIGKVEQLLNAGIDVNSRDSRFGTTPLMAASFSDNSLPIAYLLIDRGADVNAQSNEGFTALMTTADWGAYSIAELLIDHGADVNLEAQTVDGHTFTALSIAITCGGYSNIVDLLIANGANVNQTFSDGTTLLMEAARWGWFLIAHALIEAGVDVNAQNNEGKTALMMTVERLGNVQVSREDSVYTMTARALIDNGADVNLADNNGRTALNMAQERGLSDIIEILKEAGARE